MPARTFPNLGLKGGYAPQETGWGDDMSHNMLAVSSLSQAVVISKISALPGTPTQSDLYLLDETHGTQPNNLAVFDDGEWKFFPPVTGWRVYNAAQSYYERFDGTVWTPDLVYRGMAFQILGTAPTAEELLMAWTPALGETVVIGDDFARATYKKTSTGTNPAAPYAMTVKLDNVSVGTITIATDGTVAFATTGTTITLVGGTNLLEVYGASTTDAGAVGYTFTLVGTVSASVPPPVLVADGSFTSDTDWILNDTGGGATVTIGSGVLHFVSGTDPTNTWAESPTTGIGEGDTITIQYDVTVAVSVPTLFISLGGSTEVSAPATVGTHTVELTCGSVGSNLRLYQGLAFTGRELTLDNISILTT